MTECDVCADFYETLVEDDGLLLCIPCAARLARHEAAARRREASK